MIYLVAYDLREPNGPADYQRIIGAIKAFGNWAHFEQSAWLIQSDANASAIRDYLRGFMRPQDILFVSKLSGDWAGWNIGDERTNWLHRGKF